MRPSPCNRSLVVTLLSIPQPAESRDQLLWLDIQPWGAVGQPGPPCALILLPFADRSHLKLLLVHYQKLESLTVVGCRLISEAAVQWAAKSVHYSAKLESHGSLKGMKMHTRS